MKKLFFAICFISYLFIPYLSFSVYTKTYEIDFSQTNLQDFSIISNISFQQDGDGISLSLPVVDLYRGAESFISSAIYFEGGILFSTVNPNNIYVWANGNAQLAGTFPDHSIITKLKKIDDNIFILTGEKGAVYFFGKSGNVKKIIEVDGYVWDVFKLNGEYYIITGNPARLYKFSLDGTFQLIFENTNEKHFLCSLVSGSVVYIGSSGTGTIYQFDGKEIKSQEIKSLLSLPEGEVTSLKEYNGDLIASTYDIVQLQQKPQQPQQQQDQKQPTTTYPMGSTGKVYRISPITRSKKILITQNGISDFEIISNKIVAITSDGRLVEFDLNSEKFSKVSFYNDNFIKIIKTGEGNFLILTGIPAGIRMVSKSTNQTVGLIETKEISLGDVSKFGRVSVDSMLPKNSTINIFVKGGNSPVEDNTWSDWIEVKDGGNLSLKGLTDFNFIKLKLVINSKDDSLLVRSVKIYYTPENSEPVIKNASYSFKDNTLNIEWNSSDPNGDSLVYDVFVKEYKSTVWQKVNKLPISEQRFSINKYLIGDGYFDIKIIVSDENSNPSGFAKTNYYIIKNIMVDITPPYLETSSIKVSNSTNSIQVNFRAIDNFALKEVKYSIDGINWYYILPEDGVMDSSVESFKLELPTNTKVLILQIMDSQGNVKVERINL
jgi:hypothetical protein